MARKTEFNHVKTKAGWMVSTPPGLSSTGKRERCYFKTRDAARDFASGLKEKTKANGENASAIPPAMAEDAVLATVVLAPWGLSLLEAARLAAAQKERESASCTVKDAVAAWIFSCEGLRAPTLASYKNATKRLSAALGDRILSSLEADDIQKALGLVGTSGAAASGYHRIGRAFWRWAAKKGWCKLEIFERVEPPRAGRKSDVEFLTVKQCRTRRLQTSQKPYLPCGGWGEGSSLFLPDASH